MSLLQEATQIISAQPMIDNLLNYGVLGIAVIAGGLFFKKYIEKQEIRDQKNYDIMLQIMEENRSESEKSNTNFTEYLRNENKELREIVSEFTEALNDVKELIKQQNK